MEIFEEKQNKTCMTDFCLDGVWIVLNKEIQKYQSIYVVSC